MREYKLSSRGWYNIRTGRNDKMFKNKERLYKICSLEFKPEYDYKIWTEEEYLNKPAPLKKDDFWDDFWDLV
jgi:hypothetical protein